MEERKITVSLRSSPPANWPFERRTLEEQARVWVKRIYGDNYEVMSVAYECRLADMTSHGADKPRTVCAEETAIITIMRFMQ